MPSIIKIDKPMYLRGIFLGKRSENIVINTAFEHKIPDIKSYIDIKAVLFDNASFSFEGLLKITKGALNTDTYLSIKCLLIGKSSRAKVVPSLEINESGIKAGHGASVGYLDFNQVNYLRARGVPEKEVQKLLIKAFLNS